MSKRLLLALFIGLLSFQDSKAQCPELENLVFYVSVDTLFSIDLISSEEFLLTGIPSSIEGITLIEGRAINALAANPDAGTIIYFGNGTAIFGYDYNADSLFAISDLAVDFPSVFTGSRINSGGGAYYDGHYYVGTDCDGVYDLEMSVDGYSVTGMSKLTSDIYQFGDLIALAVGCNNRPALYMSSSPSNPPGCTSTPLLSGIWEFDLTDSTFTQTSTVYEGQFATNSKGVLFRGGVPGGNGKEIQNIDPCTGALSGPVTFSTRDIDDMTGPGICPQIPYITLVGVPDFDTVPGYDTVAVDVLANDPSFASPTSVNITSGPSNGSATNFGGIITYVPVYGFTGYDTLYYSVCDINHPLNCDTVLVVIGIGDDFDMDGLLDVNECPSWDLNIATCDMDGDNIPNIYDTDSDGDSILDEYECPMYNGIVSSCDTDMDGAPDYLDTDSDDDGVSDAIECPGWTGTGCDADGDGTPDFRDDDTGPPIVGVPDFDSIPGYDTLAIDVLANDPPRSDPASVNIISGPSNGSATNSNGIITYTPVFGFTGYDSLYYEVCDIYLPLNCDTVLVVFAIGDDHDMDGLLDVYECPSWDLDVASCDMDGDNIPNIYDTDSDGDSILDEYECPMYNGIVSSCDTDNDGAPDYLDLDSDNDGLSDEIECPNWQGSGCDTDGDGKPNFRDEDSDDDGFNDGTFNEFPTVDCDADGISDYLDPDPCEICIPEGFSPNGDGSNDVFEIIGLEFYPNNRLKVFNRWGELVFDQRNYQNNWEGDNQGGQEIISNEKLPIGTYYVIFEYESLGALRAYDGIVYISY